MAGPSIKLTELRRFQFAKFLGIGHWICILPSFICLLSALFIQVSIEDKVAFIENYNGAILPGFLVFTGFYGLVTHIAAGKVIFTNRLVEKREKWAPFLLPIIVATGIIFLAEFIAGIMTFAHISDLEESFDDGIKKAMAAYKDDATTKEEVDVLQMAYECCGSRSYEEWFSISWIHPDYLETGESSTGLQDVPFSCCNSHVLRPCIRRSVHDNAKHYKYDYQSQTTINEQGCTDVLIAYYEDSVLKIVGALVLGLSFIQIFMCLASRVLQTAIVGAMTSDDPSAPSFGYLFGSAPDGGGGGGKGANTTMTSTDGETLEDTTVDSTFTDEFDERYTELGGASGADGDEPFYENVPPFEISNEFNDDEHIYNEGEVEEYLANKYARSRERFETVNIDDIPPPPPLAGEDDEGGDIEAPPPIDMVKVSSNTGNYMSMNMSNSSRTPFWTRYDRSWSSKPRAFSSSADLHHRRHDVRKSPYPSPPGYQNFHSISKSPLIINMARKGFSPIAKPRHSSPKRQHRMSPSPYVSPERRRLLPSPPRHLGHGPIQRHHYVKEREHTHLHEQAHHRNLPQHWQTRPTIHGIQVFSEKQNGSPSKKRCSPHRRVSPIKTSFRSGVSYNCNHALE